MQIEIGTVNAADVRAIGALARLVWQDAYPGIIPQRQIDFMLEQRYNEPCLLEELASSSIWWDRITVDGQLAGFASSLLTSIPREIKLDKLYVHPNRQRLGLGGRLISQVVERASVNGCETLILAVNKRNERAIAAYRKHGFAVREAVCVDIGRGFVMDDFIMAKSLILPNMPPNASA
jgi:diamine N-acetyltransferase